MVVTAFFRVPSPTGAPVFKGRVQAAFATGYHASGNPASANKHAAGAEQYRTPVGSYVPPASSRPWYLQDCSSNGCNATIIYTDRLDDRDEASIMVADLCALPGSLCRSQTAKKALPPAAFRNYVFNLLIINL